MLYQDIFGILLLVWDFIKPIVGLVALVFFIKWAVLDDIRENLTSIERSSSSCVDELRQVKHRVDAIERALEDIRKICDSGARR